MYTRIWKKKFQRNMSLNGISKARFLSVNFTKKTINGIPSIRSSIPENLPTKDNVKNTFRNKCFIHLEIPLLNIYFIALYFISTPSQKMMKYGFFKLKYLFNVFININIITISEFQIQNVILLQSFFI